MIKEKRIFRYSESSISDYQDSVDSVECSAFDIQQQFERELETSSNVDFDNYLLYLRKKYNFSYFRYGLLSETEPLRLDDLVVENDANSELGVVLDDLSKTIERISIHEANLQVVHADSQTLVETAELQVQTLVETSEIQVQTLVETAEIQVQTLVETFQADAETQTDPQDELARKEQIIALIQNSKSIPFQAVSEFISSL